MREAQASAARHLRWSLRAGAVWFALVALAHTSGIKLPGLFIYFDLPSHAYQDRIIGFLAFGWAVFFHATARDPQAARPLVAAILAAGLAAVAGLAAINLRTDFAGLAAGARVESYWLGCGAALAYWGWVLRLYLRMEKPGREAAP